MNRLRLSTVTLILGALLAAAAPSGLRAAEPTSPKIDMAHPLAAFLETREFATLKGATGEFTKLEGAAIDPLNRKYYVTQSDITSAMSDAKGDIQVAENRCGAVWVGDLDENWNLINLKPLLIGGPYDPTKSENHCNVDAIANPDALMVDSYGNLWIGDDTKYHVNNYLWRWDGKELKRFASLPIGAGVTGLTTTAAGDLFLNLQHPDGLNLYPYNRATVGVIKGFAVNRSFSSVPVPKGDDTRRLLLASGEYQVLGRTGEAIPGDFEGARFGQRTNADGTFNLSSNPDGNMFLPTNAAGTEGYLYSNVEARPAGASRLYIRKDARGDWQVVEGENVDFRPIGGAWGLCAATVTPWGTAMTSEEGEPAVSASWATAVQPMATFLGRPVNPYDYGYMIEMVPNSVGTKATKRYAMGRLSHELANFAPDRRTAYMTDDHDFGVLTKFVADKEGDLSSGTLYAAKLVQQAGSNSFKVEWLRLGASSDKEVAAAVRALNASFGVK